MACVTYNCNECGNFWAHGPAKCPQCGSENVYYDWDEAGDFSSVNFDDGCELPDSQEEEEQLG